MCFTCDMLYRNKMCPLIMYAQFRFTFGKKKQERTILFVFTIMIMNIELLNRQTR